MADDEKDLREVLTEALRVCGATVFQAADGREGLQLLKSNPVHIVFSDVRMPGGSGLQFLDAVQSLPEPRPAFVLVSGFADLTRSEALRRGALEMLGKPFRLSEIRDLAARLLPPEASVG